MASTSYRLADFAGVIGYARQAVRLAANNRNSGLESDALDLLGHALHDLGRLPAAEEGWRQSLAIAVDLGDGERIRHLEEDLAKLTPTVLDRLVENDTG
jgi:hypothetical protein